MIKYPHQVIARALIYGCLIMRQMSQKKKQRIFAKAIEPEYDRVFNFIYSRLNHGPELAQDVTQDVMELAWKQLDQLRNMDSARAWLMQITMNEIRKHYRAQGTIKRGAFQEVSYDAAEFADLQQLDKVEADVLDVIIQKEQGQLLMAALNRVREPYQTILDLRLIQELKFAEIAEIVEVSEATARVYYGRGLKMLRKEYETLTSEGREQDA